MLENQTAWNSDNQGIKETVNQNNQTGKAADRENLRQGCRLHGRGWLKGPRARRQTRQRSPRQRNRAQMKDQSKTPERELSDEEIANLSDGQFKALVMLTELIELGCQMKKQMKATQSEIK